MKKKQDNKFTYLNEVTKELEQELISQYSEIFQHNDIQEINNYVISDWLMRCPLNFR